MLWISTNFIGVHDADAPQQAKEMEADMAMLPAFSNDKLEKPSTKDATAPEGGETVTAAVHHQEAKNGRKRALGGELCLIFTSLSAARRFSVRGKICMAFLVLLKAWMGLWPGMKAKAGLCHALLQ